MKEPEIKKLYKNKLNELNKHNKTTLIKIHLQFQIKNTIN